MTRDDPEHLFVATACDAAYAMPMAAMLRSLTENLRSVPKATAFVLQSDLSAALRAKVARSIDADRLELRWLDVARDDFHELQATLGRPHGSVVTIETYYRLLLPDRVPAEIDRLLYLDADLIVNTDLGALWREPLADYDLLAVPELAAPALRVSSSSGLALWRELELPADLKMFNAGVLLINLATWRRDNLPGRAFAYLRAHRDQVRWHDQDALNAVIAGNWGELNPRWNVTNHVYQYDVSQPPYCDWVSDPWIVHFNGEWKPWQVDYAHKNADLFFRYLEMTAWAGWKPRDYLQATYRRMRHFELRIRRRWPRRAGKRVRKWSKRTRKRARKWSKRVRRAARAPWRLVSRVRRTSRHRRSLRRIDVRAIPERPEIRLFAVVRNEALRLPYLLDYYRSRGVDRAFFVDNASTDETQSILLAQENVHVFETAESYADSQCGMLWLMPLLHRHGRGHWCVVVDADELVAYPDWENRSLRDLCAYLDHQGYDALRCLQIDMYSGKSLRDTTCRPGESPLVVCPYFDTEYREVERTYEDRLSGRRFPIRTWIGGVRERVFGLAAYHSKIPLLRYDGKLSPNRGMHWVQGASPSDIRGSVLHFKFLSDFNTRVVEEARREEHEAQAAEYKVYAREVEHDEDLCLLFEGSTRFRDSRQLVELGLMESSAAFEAFPGAPGKAHGYRRERP